MKDFLLRIGFSIMEVVPFLESAFRMSILQQSSGKYFNFFGHPTSVTADLRKIAELNFFSCIFYLQIYLSASQIISMEKKSEKPPLNFLA